MTANEDEVLAAEGERPEVTALPPKRKKFNNIGAPKCFALEAACKQVTEAFNAFGGYGGLYVVGSVLERPDWRDVDVRLILDDVEFAKLFPQAGQHWEFDPRWLLMTVSISEHLSRVTGLPIDFQFQPRTHANDRHKGNRNPIGMRFAPEPQPSAAPATGANNKEHAP